MVHDFKKFPELRNSEMDLYYWRSPHKQIFEDFDAFVLKVHDGDTIEVRANFRNFTFPVRFLDISARELKPNPNEQTFSSSGISSQQWLEKLLLNKIITVRIDPKNRVEKWGRLLGKIELSGLNVGDESIINNMSVPWANRLDGVILNHIIPSEDSYFKSPW